MSKSLFDKLVDGRASAPQFAMVVLHLRTVPSSAARCFASADFASLCVHNSAWSFRIARKLACGSPCLIGLTPRCFAHRARASCAPRHCHPHQFPLKSCGFSGAETARKQFLLWKMGFSGAKIAPSPPYTPPGTIEARKGFVPLFGFSTVSGARGKSAPRARVQPIWRFTSPWRTTRSFRARYPRRPGRTSFR